MVLRREKSKKSKGKEMIKEKPVQTAPPVDSYIGTGMKRSNSEAEEYIIKDSGRSR